MNAKTEALGLMGAQHQMMIEMQRMQAQASSGAIAPAPLSDAPAGLNFGKVLDSAITHVDNQQHIASQKQREIEMGTSDDLVGTMVESQKASVAFSAMMQVRNKLQQSFDEVMNISL
ncbi:flagellar hook-basal body complex protein FliE [Enterobacterales bacterium CwR94]|nr:flagellar hook-basal body complex protein FliE [Enterobacterales bacterium CwR94]